MKDDFGEKNWRYNLLDILSKIKKVLNECYIYVKYVDFFFFYFDNIGAHGFSYFTCTDNYFFIKEILQLYETLYIVFCNWNLEHNLFVFVKKSYCMVKIT